MLLGVRGRESRIVLFVGVCLLVGLGLFLRSRGSDEPVSQRDSAPAPRPALSPPRPAAPEKPLPPGSLAAAGQASQDGEPNDEVDLPTPVPPGRDDFQAVSPEELRQRQEAQVQLITDTVRQLDAQIENARTAGRHDLVSILEHRRENLERRRDELQGVLDE